MALPSASHAFTYRKAVCLLQQTKPSIERVLIALCHVVPSGIVTTISFGESRELPTEEWKEAVPRCGTEPERRPDHIAGARLLRCFHQLCEARPIIRDARDNRRH